MEAPETTIAGGAAVLQRVGAGGNPRGALHAHLCPCSRSQGGGYDRSSGGSYRDSYDSYGKWHSKGWWWEFSAPRCALPVLIRAGYSADPVRDKTALSGLGASSHFY